MRLLTKAEACRDLRLSLSTLNQRIAAGDGAVRREPRGRRHRVYVMLDEDPPQSELAVAQEWIRVLEEQLESKRRRNAELVNDLKVATSHYQRRPRWRFWQGR